MPEFRTAPCLFYTSAEARFRPIVERPGRPVENNWRELTIRFRCIMIETP